MVDSDGSPPSKLFFLQNVEGDLASGKWQMTGQMKSHIRGAVVERLKQSRLEKLQFDHKTAKSFSNHRIEGTYRSRSSISNRSTRHSKSQTTRKAGALTSPTTILNSGNRDPFDTCILKLDPFAIDLLKLVAQYHLSMIWPIEFSTLSNPQITSHWWKDLRDYLGDSVRLPSLLAFAATLKQHVHHQLADKIRQATKARALYYKTKTISGLAKRRLDSPTTAQIIATMNLAWLEAYSQDLASMKLHYTAVRHVVNAAGGLDKLTWLHREYIFATTLNISMIIKECPTFSAEDYEPDSIVSGARGCWSYIQLQSELSSELSAQKRKTGTILELFDPQVGRLITDLQELFAVEYLRRHRLRDSRKHSDVYRWMQNRQTSCRSRLHVQRLWKVDPVLQQLTAGLSADHKYASELEGKLLNACAILGASFAIVITMWGARERMDRWDVLLGWECDLLRCLGKLSQILDERLPVLVEDLGLVDKLHVLLWSTIMASCAHRMISSAAPVGLQIYKNALKALMTKLRLKALDQLRSTCERMLWSDEIMSLALREIFDVPV